MNLEKVFSFIKEKKGYDYPVRYKLINGIPLTKNELYIKGDLDLSRTKLTSLPDNFTVDGDLDIHHTNINSLPNNLKVIGDLDIRYTNVTSLPDNLKIITFFVSHTPLANIYNKDEIKHMINEKGGMFRFIFK